jgi:hypothetical protein
MCSLLMAALFTLAAEPSASIARPLGDLTGPWQLFVDDALIAEKSNVARKYHAFEKYPLNPVLKPDKPWEGGAAYLYGSVLPGEDGHGYRMWYHSWANDVYHILYATSPDGLRWEKPELGLVSYGNDAQNNILIQRTREDHNPQVIATPNDPNPERRYKLINWDYGRTPPDHTVSGYWGAWSRDGVHWTDAPKNPVLPDPGGDVGNFTWDPHKARYIGYPKQFTDVCGAHRRCTGFSETKDFESWPPGTLVLTPDEFDDRWVTKAGQHTDFYGLCGFAYESMYLGFLWIFRITGGKNDGPIYVELVSSRDGAVWTREEEPRPPLLPLSPKGAWDGGMIFTANQPLVEGNTIKLYYGGFDATHGVDAARAAIGLATLRKNGFASLDAGAQEGIVTTKPLQNARGPLAVNYAAKDGALQVEVIAETGAVVPGYGREDCAPLTGDSANETVVWKTQRELPESAGRVQLRFILRNASLYAFDAGANAAW